MNKEEVKIDQIEPNCGLEDEDGVYGNYIMSLPSLDRAINDIILLQNEIQELRQLIAELETKLNTFGRTYGPQTTPRNQSKTKCFPTLSSKN